MNDAKLSIIDHLEELRFRILWSLGAVAIMFTPGYFLALPAINALIKFACPQGTTIRYIRPMELFFTQLEVALLFGVIFALPIITYQIWQFVAPALYKNEKQLVTRLSGVSCFLFLFGVAFSIFFVFPAIMRFSIGMETDQIKAELVIDSFISLAICLSVGFGAMFQLPIVIFFLIMSGIVPLSSMQKLRPVIVAVIFILAAVLTPPDVVSQLSLGLPTWALFEISLIFSKKALSKHIAKREEEEARERAEEEAEEARLAAERSAQSTPAASQDNNTIAIPQNSDIPDGAQDYGYSNEPPYDYYNTYDPAAGATATPMPKIRNLTPGKHFSRRTRTRTR